MESHYTVNVATRGTDARWHHYCRIELGSDRESALYKMREMRVMFGPEYKLDLTYWHCTGQIVDSQ